MPELRQHTGALDTITLPQSGVKVTLRRRANGQDKAEALEAVRGDIRAGDMFNPSQAQARFLCYVAAALIASWDAVDEKGEPIPVTVREIAAIADERDYEFLIADVNKRVQLRGEQDEANFEPSSSPSSAATSSKTRKTTRRS